MDVSVSLIIAGLSVLVGLLCLWLAVVALVRLGKAKKGRDVGGDTPATLKGFALRQSLSAVVMFALAAIIVVFS
ncbi:hypothetical protein ASE00_09345 [Sphingomonas sp. Root710]|uniref:hypothetical protein n=1 Tax=Sphingomonas sp. Root710 TaxID=1736594 RepID=UPI0006F2A9F2|nr:hypothetical protein [Sphingomonas sp. Root710]KRB82281.1 hypothetical protein ASE00_09345 [Sphingomonas sp. Root710]